jgi:hypothetical protein
VSSGEDQNLRELKQAQLNFARDQYLQVVQHLTSQFQFIEEGLRVSIESAYDLIRLRTGDVLAYTLDYMSLEKDSLGKLIQKFATIFDDAGLVSRLQKLAPMRNHCAHQALLVSTEKFENLKSLDEERERLAGTLIEAKGTLIEAKDCFAQVMRHWAGVSGVVVKETKTEVR